MTMKGKSETKFEWMRDRQSSPVVNAKETHFSIKQIAEMWSCSKDSVFRIFRDEPGVLKLGSEKHRVLRIPSSVLDRVHRRRSNV